MSKYKQYGSEWKKIQQHLPGRAVNAIKNRFFHLKHRKNVLHKETKKYVCIQNLSPIDEYEMYLEKLRIENLTNH